jgi:hypothetical protein
MVFATIWTQLLYVSREFGRWRFVEKTCLIDEVGDNGKVELQVTGKLKSG